PAELKLKQAEQTIADAAAREKNLKGQVIPARTRVLESAVARAAEKEAEAKAAVALETAAADRLAAQLARCEIRAPVAGWVQYPDTFGPPGSPGSATPEPGVLVRG